MEEININMKKQGIDQNNEQLTVLSIFRLYSPQGDCLEVLFSTRIKTKCWGSRKGPAEPVMK